MGSPEDEDLLFATKRFDRKLSQDGKLLNGLPVPYRLHQEDFSQALGIAASNKYEKNQEGYMKKIFDILKNYSADPITDQLKLWDICVFNYLVGNTDNHIKNLSLLYSEDLKSVRLAPAYDIISTLIYESSTENMALSIGGKYSIKEINRDSFENEAVNVGLGSKMAMRRFDKMVKAFTTAMEETAQNLKQEGYTDAPDIFKQIMRKGGISFQL